MDVAWRWIVVLVPLVWTWPVGAAEPPVPPCAGSPRPAWTSADAPPAVAIWRAEDLPNGWQPASCSGLKVADGAVLVGLAGSFREPGGLTAILRRLGAVSRQVDIRYWSTSRQAWRPMLEDAAALAAPKAAASRADIEPQEFRHGARLYAVYDDSDPIGPVVYETVVQMSDPDGVSLVARNLERGRLMGFTVAEPGSLASLLTVQRQEGDLFRYYALVAVALSPMASAMVPDASHINRAVATFRYVAGIPTDTEPPAAAN